MIPAALRTVVGTLLVAGLTLLVACSGESDRSENSDSTTTSVAPSPVTVIEGPGALDVIGDTGRFGTFLGLVEEAGLTETVAVGGPWTIFAPDDAALAALDPGVLEVLREDAEAARSFVLAHVVGGVWRGADLAGLDGQTLTTEAATTISFVLTEGVITISGEPEGGVVVEPLSLEAANAIIHAVGRPLPPPE